MNRRVFAMLILGVSTMLAAPAFGQDGSDAQPSDDQAAAAAGASVVTLKFEVFHANAGVMDYFYTALDKAIDHHPKMHTKAGGNVSVKDMALTMGCDSSKATCLSGLSDFVDADRIVFGSVQHTDDVYLLSLKMFDFAQGKFIRQVDDETIEGQPAEIKSGIDAVIEGFLYGDVGKLVVSANGADNAQVYFDGQKRGTAPLTLTELPLGEHAVTVQGAGARKKSTKVILKRGQVSRLTLDVAPDSGRASSSGSDNTVAAVSGWTAVGVGAAGLAMGIVGTLQLGDYNTQADELICGSALCRPGNAARAEQLQGDMDSAYTLSVVGYSAAAVGLAVGSYFLYQAYAGDADTADQPGAGSADQPSGADVQFSLAPSPNGASVGMRVGF